MSAQTIIYNRISSLVDDIDDFYICQGNNYINKVDYDLGKGADMNKFLIIEWLDRIITSNNACKYVEDGKLLQKLNLILLK